MHMVSEKDLNSTELEPVRTSRSPTTVMTANGEVQTREEATVNFKALDLLVTVMLLEETPAVLSLEKLCDEHEYTYHWKSGQNPHLTIRSHFGLKPFPVRTCAVFFPFTSFSGFVLCKCLQPSFVVSHLFSWHV